MCLLIDCFTQFRNTKRKYAMPFRKCKVTNFLSRHIYFFFTLDSSFNTNKLSFVKLLLNLVIVSYKKKKVIRGITKLQINYR